MSCPYPMDVGTRRRRRERIASVPGRTGLSLDVRDRPLRDIDGFAFCRSLPERAGVVAVPNAVFYDHKDEGAPFVRFAFCKRTDVLDKAVARLGRRLLTAPARPPTASASVPSPRRTAYDCIASAATTDGQADSSQVLWR